MPSCKEFEFRILIGGEKVKEYQHGGETLIESNLFTVVSYESPVKEYANGEIECQNWPVTPYEIQINISPLAPSTSWVYTYVDGTEVDHSIGKAGDIKIVKGFKQSDEIKEFLFSLPRFARNEKDRLEANRRSEVGTIKVELKEAMFLRNELKYPSALKSDSGYNQANKKDANNITGGKYIMATTKVGRHVSSAPYSNPNKKLSYSIYDIGNKVSSLNVKYHMKHTLEDLGIVIEAK